MLGGTTAAGGEYVKLTNGEHWETGIIDLAPCWVVGKFESNNPKLSLKF